MGNLASAGSPDDRVPVAARSRRLLGQSVPRLVRHSSGKRKANCSAIVEPSVVIRGVAFSRRSSEMRVPSDKCDYGVLSTLPAALPLGVVAPPVFPHVRVSSSLQSFFNEVVLDVLPPCRQTHIQSATLSREAPSGK